MIIRVRTTGTSVTVMTMGRRRSIMRSNRDSMLPIVIGNSSAEKTL